MAEFEFLITELKRKKEQYPASYRGTEEGGKDPNSGREVAASTS
jgi:hypothetical protein